MHVLCYFVKYSIAHVVSVGIFGKKLCPCHREAQWCIKLIEKRWSAPSFWLVHPGRLTWNLQITQLNRKLIFQPSFFRFHVNLPGCTLSHYLLPGISRIITPGVPWGVNPAVISPWPFAGENPTPPALAAASPKRCGTEPREVATVGCGEGGGVACCCWRYEMLEGNFIIWKKKRHCKR